MRSEITMLGLSTLLGIGSLLVAGAMSTSVRGLKWNAGNRDEAVPPLSGAPARASRAASNFMETFPIFVAALLGVLAAGRSSSFTMLGVQLYFWARVVYLPIYIVGVPFLRTAVWTVSLIGILMLLGSLIH